MVPAEEDVGCAVFQFWFPERCRWKTAPLGSSLILQGLRIAHQPFALPVQSQEIVQLHWRLTDTYCMLLGLLKNLLKSDMKHCTVPRVPRSYFCLWLTITYNFNIFHVILFKPIFVAVFIASKAGVSTVVLRGRPHGILGFSWRKWTVSLHSHNDGNGGSD